MSDGGSMSRKEEGSESRSEDECQENKYIHNDLVASNDRERNTRDSREINISRTNN